MLSQRQLEELMLLTCGVESCVPGYEYDAGDREGYHLHVILSGKGILSVNGQITQLHFGQMFITKPGEATWYRADREDPWSYCWMAYDGTEALQYTEAAEMMQPAGKDVGGDRDLRNGAHLLHDHRDSAGLRVHHIRRGVRFAVDEKFTAVGFLGACNN